MKLREKLWGCLFGVILMLAGLPFSGQVASHDQNGNQVVRNKGVPNQEQVLTWDAENRLSTVTYTNRTTTGGSGQLPTTCNGVPCKRVFLPLVMQQSPAERYSYDADGARVRKETKTEVTRTIGPHFEVTVAITNSQALTTTKYYDFGGQRIAVRQNGTLSYLHGDHLGSTSVTTSNTGVKTNDVRYFAYGGQRSGNLFALPTDHAFTGQKLDRSTGLMYYGARYYDPALGMFVSPDSLIPDPGNPQDLNRYSYVRNNPLRYTDPTGHCVTPLGIPIPGCFELLLRAGQQVEALVVQYGPAVTQLLQQWADKLPALVDKAGQLINGSQQAASQAGNTADPGGFDPNKWGKWVERSETMSDRARAYQEHVTGRADNRVFQVDGVNFDGIRDGTLLDAKGYYKQFIDSSTGSFKAWWQGADDIVQQAQRQIEVAKGTRIEWHFNEAETLEAVRKLFAEKGIGQGITLILDQMP